MARFIIKTIEIPYRKDSWEYREYEEYQEYKKCENHIKNVAADFGFVLKDSDSSYGGYTELKFIFDTYSNKNVLRLADLLDDYIFEYIRILKLRQSIKELDEESEGRDEEDISIYSQRVSNDNGINKSADKKREIYETAIKLHGGQSKNLKASMDEY
ncbi:hypothetical protein NXS15_00415 [Mycoplasma sp. CSL7475-4]|uniref:hypothetical protein n=1 Tax=Mycoplasma sp. CSL7475-4 TaxID=2973942 RepID=UPI00216AD00A|nr:hypothetical protein [Mycoplasma sp. CSL7475-4]MCS4536595.1 hypothetical protein [Mycoplasma sp. CSL7475-4]